MKRPGSLTQNGREKKPVPGIIFLHDTTGSFRPVVVLFFSSKRFLGGSCLKPFTTGNPFLGTKLLGFSIGRGSGALKGLSLQPGEPQKNTMVGAPVS